MKEKEDPFFDYEFKKNVKVAWKGKKFCLKETSANKAHMLIVRVTFVYSP